MMMMVSHPILRSNLDKVLNNQSTCGWTCVCATYMLTPGLYLKPLMCISLVCIRIGLTLTLELLRESISLRSLLWRHLMLSSTWRAILLQDHPTGKIDRSIFFSDSCDDVKAKLTEVLVIRWRCKGVELIAYLPWNRSIGVFAKIESSDSLKNLEDIIRVSDGAMVARGDLGAQIPLEQVPSVQQEIVNTCRRLNKPVIVASQLLESMIEYPTPTRAEVRHINLCNSCLSSQTSGGKFII